MTLCRLGVTCVEFVYTTGTVMGPLTSDVNTVMFSLAVPTTLLTAFGFIVVFMRGFLEVYCLETTVSSVGVVLFTVAGDSVRSVGEVGEEVRLVTFGAFVVRAMLFRKVLFAVRVLLRLVNVILRVSVTLAVLGFLPVPGVGEVK